MGSNLYLHFCLSTPVSHKNFLLGNISDLLHCQMESPMNSSFKVYIHSPLSFHTHWHQTPSGPYHLTARWLLTASSLASPANLCKMFPLTQPFRNTPFPQPFPVLPPTKPNLLPVAHLISPSWHYFLKNDSIIRFILFSHTLPYI